MSQEATIQQDNALGTAPVGKLLFRLALPCITAQLVNVLYNIVDRMYIGHIEGIGEMALTGMGVCMPVITAVSAFAALAAMGGASKASIYMGSKNQEKAENILGACTAFLILIALFLTAVMLLFTDPMLYLFGASENTIGYAREYMQIYAIGTIFVQLTLGLNNFITAQGFSKVSMYTTLIGAVFNIVLDPIFIFLFDMGVRGAALATIISQAISAIWVIRFLTGTKTTLKLRLDRVRIMPKLLIPCLALGLSPFTMQFTNSVINVFYNKSLLFYGGDTAVGAMVILSSVNQFTFLLIQGLSQGAQPITGYNYGAANVERVKHVVKLLICCSFCYATLAWGIIQMFPKQVCSIFVGKGTLLDYSAQMLTIYMKCSLLMGIQNACQQSFLSIGNAKISLFLAVLRKIILIMPLILLMPRLFPADPVSAIFAAEPIADVIAVSTTATMFFFYFRKAMAELEKKRANMQA